MIISRGLSIQTPNSGAAEPAGPRCRPRRHQRRSLLSIDPCPLPVVLVGLNLAGIVKGRQLFKSWRITVFLVCLFSAMAAPGADATSMFYRAVPLLLLFFAATGFCMLNDHRRERRAIKLAAEIEATADTATPVSELQHF